MTTLPPQPSLGDTHLVHNVSSELNDFNAYETDIALCEAVAREQGSWGQQELTKFGELTGKQSYRELGYLANKFKPELDTHDRFGHRVDLVRYHDAYHQLMKVSLENGLHSSVWNEPKAGANVVRAAKSLMQAQVEAGHGCPVTMTFASIPSLRIQPEVAQLFESKVLHAGYDPRNIPFTEKQSLTVGMGMTEKQGGSDVRANTTLAKAVGQSGPGNLYQLTGHKWFLSAPMCDLFLVLAQAPGGLSCFAVPRWLPDGTKNGLQVIRLKDKMGNQSNASSEVEFRQAQGWLIGEEGRGVPTIIEMVSLTRFDCMVGSSAGMRAGLVHAVDHCTKRAAFGKRLIDQPLMQNVLADLALEYEASIALSMRMARALDQRYDNPQEASLARLMTAVGKYWICKRGPQHAYEVMECIGGSGVMENSIYPRLFRESVINPIWEGSGNVQCLDVLRALGKSPDSLSALFTELELGSGANPYFDNALNQLKQNASLLTTSNPEEVQFMARSVVDSMALLSQAALLLQHAPNVVSEAFCRSRLGLSYAQNYGGLPVGSDVKTILNRVMSNVLA